MKAKFKYVLIFLVVSMIISTMWRMFVSPDAIATVIDWLQLHQPSKHYVVEPDISYVEPPDGKRKGDLYLPVAEGKQSFPFLLSMHGGNWKYGSKSDFEERVMARYFAEHGYVVFVIDYRLLSDGALFPDNVTDVKDALRFAVSNKDKWKIDPEKIFVMGSSSAASAVLLAAYTSADKPNAFGVKFGTSPRVRAACSISGHTDLSDAAGNPGLKQYLQLKDDNRVCAAGSPVNYLDGAVPTILIHGDSDNTVSISQSKSLYEALQKHGVKTRFIVAPGQDHFIGSASRHKCLDEISKFFASVCRPAI